MTERKAPSRSGRTVSAMNDAYLREVRLRRDNVPSFDVYPFSLPAIRHLDRLVLDARVTIVVGENGTGKSTLLEAIAVAWGLNAEGGSRNFAFGTRASHSDLHRHLVLSRGARRPRDAYFLRAESLFNVATEIERLDREGGCGPPILLSYGGRSLHEQSHGESFLAVLTERLGGQGFYVFDEPEAALSPMRQLALLRRIHDLVQLDSQILIATHSPILMAYPGAQILVAGPERLVAAAYDQIEHVRVARAFLANPQRMLGPLLDDAPQRSYPASPSERE